MSRDLRRFETRDGLKTVSDRSRLRQPERVAPRTQIYADIEYALRSGFDAVVAGAGGNARGRFPGPGPAGRRRTNDSQDGRPLVYADRFKK